MREKPILIIAGPSAGGKTTLSEKVMELFSTFRPVRSVTTRAPRGDRHDDEYTYVSRERFFEMVREGELLEHAEYSGDLYGTPRAEIDRIHDEGCVPLLVLNLEGVASLAAAIEYDVCALYVFSDPNVAEQRLYDRYIGESPTPEGLARFVRRKDQNLEDYAILPSMAALFYATVENFTTVSDAVVSITMTYGAFARGEQRQAEKVSSDFEALADFARRKTENAR